MYEHYSVEGKIVVNGKTLRKNVRPIFSRGEYNSFSVPLENGRDGAFTTPHIFSSMFTTKNHMAMKKPNLYRFEGPSLGTFNANGNFAAAQEGMECRIIRTINLEIEFNRHSIAGKIKGLATPLTIEEYELANSQEAKGDWNYEISFYVPLERMAHIFALSESTFERLNNQLSRI